MRLRPLELRDRRAWADMRAALWPDADAAELAHETVKHFAGVKAADEVWVAEDPVIGRLLGFLELSLRPYAENCASSPVPYIEAWYVTAEARHTGVGRALVEAAENWARLRGFAEIASDALLENDASHAAHRALGFEETARIVCYRKSLGV
jgi:aminoglycoside 6'-N-acetyltransferase I